MKAFVYQPGPTPETVRTAEGQILPVPVGWSLLPPGDAALTRRVKTAGEHWVIQEKKGRRVFSRGLWASTEVMNRLREELAIERATESFSKRKIADSNRRNKTQARYEEDFRDAVIAFLAFHPLHHEFAQLLSQAVADHATPIGSGTVARTKRIPIDERAEAAVIAWLRHQTTSYDSMRIPRIKGKRREVRRLLAQHSKELLRRFRCGDPIEPNCPLQQALRSERTQ